MVGQKEKWFVEKALDENLRDRGGSCPDSGNPGQYNGKQLDHKPLESRMKGKVIDTIHYGSNELDGAFRAL
jgi:hypothetical protein